MARQMMKYLKRDTFEDLKATGSLRSHFDFGFGSEYIPKLYSQAEYNCSQADEQENSVTQALTHALTGFTSMHKQAILDEARRVEEVKMAAARKKAEEERARVIRKDTRKALREAKRIEILQEKIVTEMIDPADKTREFKLQEHDVYDIRTYNQERPGIYTIGGLIGELCICFSAIINAMEEKDENTFRPGEIRKFLQNFLEDEF